MITWRTARYYTRDEGGPWLRWREEFGLISEVDLAQRDSYYVLVGKCIRVHSLLLSISLDTDAYERWDCINGFTGLKPMTEVMEETHALR